MAYIKSKDNEKFKTIKSLLASKKRYKEKKYLAEGLRTVELALEHGADIDMVILREGSEFDLDLKDLRVHTLSKDLYDQVSDTENSQGIMAVVKTKDLSIDDFDPTRYRRVLVLDRLQDPGNVGTIIRTADAMGFDLICMTKGCFYMDLLMESQEAILSILKGAGLQIVSSSLDTDNYYDEVTYADRCALVLGNEANGINDFWVENSDLLVKIPMYGKAESFNVAISGALLMSKMIKRENK